MSRLLVPFMAILLATAVLADGEPAETLDKLTFIEAGGFTAARLLSDDPVKQETGKRMSDAIILSIGASTLLKEVVTSHRPAPYDDEEDGFPSRHTIVAFATAAALTEREPKAKWVAYPLAAVAGWAREDLNKHTWAQVLGGAALGVWIGHLAGEGKLRIFGHRDSEAPGGVVSSTGMGISLFSTRF